MKKSTNIKNVTPAKEQPSPPITRGISHDKPKSLRTAPDKPKPELILLIFAYLFIPVFTPSFGTFDSNGTKFLSIALINLIAWPVLHYARRNSQGPGAVMSRNFIGLVYILFVGVHLLSFLNAVNLTEAVLNFTKVFTIFIATYNIFVLVKRYRSLLELVTISLVLLLLFDCLTVFYNIMLFVLREVHSIMDIKSIYSHKNILTSAIFVKIPFALFLITYHTGWKRILGYITAVLSVVAILMLSTRAFYLGLVLLIICLIIFYMLRQRSAGNKKIYLITFRWAGMLVLAILAYSVVQRFVFPSNTDSIWNTNVVSRIGSISANESSTKARLDSWQRTVQLIRDHPLLGTGTGNWKIAVLQYENQTSPDFLYMYKNHNDFLETTAETGMVGGVLFLMIILLCIRSIATSTLNDTDEAINGALFLSGFGMIAYSVDAFFNFPSDRPEIQIMFALFLAIAIACSERRYTLKLKALETSHIQKAVKPVNYFLSALSLLLIAVSVYILFLNVRSLYFQKICYSEINNKRLMHNAVVIEQGFPKIPSVTSFGEPVSILISRYLMNERKFQEAIELLKKDHSSPWDSRREYYLAKYYYELQEFDSAITWSLRALPLKPLHVNTVLTIGKLLYMKNQNQHALKILTTYLDNNPYDPRVWVLAANHHVALRQRNEAISLLDMAMIYLPADSTVTNLRKRLSTRQQ